jgi:hypothetical protein
MKNLTLCLALSLLNTAAFAGSLGDLQSAGGGLDSMDAKAPVCETPVADAASEKRYQDYNFRCLAGPYTPEYIKPSCYLYTAKGQQACVNAGCSWGMGDTPLPDYNYRCMAGPSTPQYVAPTCYLYTSKGQQACLSAGCNWGMGGTPLPSFHCAAASFTPQYVAPTCYLYTAQGQRACVNAGCSWTFGTKSSPEKSANQQNAALRKIALNEFQPDADDALIAKLKREPGIEVVTKELTEAGFKVQAMNDASGYYFLSVDATGLDAMSTALGLAKYPYVTKVLVSEKIYHAIFTVPQ